MGSLPARLVDLHRDNNRSSAGAWERFAAHRRRVTELVLEAAPGGRVADAALGSGTL
jgi:hypothetical protein